MSAKAANGGMRGAFALVLAAGVASAIGLPVASWAVAVLVVCVACAGFAHLVGLRDAAKGFAGPILWSAALAMGAPMLGAMTRAIASDPDVRSVAGVIGAVALLAAVTFLLAKALAPRGNPASAQPRPTVRARARVVEPVVAPAPPRSTPSAESATDDLDLYGGRRGPR